MQLHFFLAKFRIIWYLFDLGLSACLVMGDLVRKPLLFFKKLFRMGTYIHKLSQLESQFDPIGRSEPSSGYETIYWDSLPALSDIGISKSHKYIDITYTKVQNKTTTVVVFTVSHIQY